MPSACPLSRHPRARDAWPGLRALSRRELTAEKMTLSSLERAPGRRAERPGWVDEKRLSCLPTRSTSDCLSRDICCDEARRMRLGSTIGMIALAAALSSQGAGAATTSAQQWGANTSALRRLAELEPRCRSSTPQVAAAACTQMIDDHGATARIRAIALVNRAAAYAANGHPESAIADYATALAINPHDPASQEDQKQAIDAAIHLYRGLVYGSVGQQNTALADYNEAIRLAPSLADAYLDRAAAFDNTGQTGRALTDYTTVISLDSKNEQLIEAGLRFI